MGKFDYDISSLTPEAINELPAVLKEMGFNITIDNLYMTAKVHTSRQNFEKAVVEADMRANEKKYGKRGRTVRVKKTDYFTVFVSEDEIEDAKKNYGFRLINGGAEAMAARNSLLKNESREVVNVEKGQPAYAGMGRSEYLELDDRFGSDDNEQYLYDFRPTMICSYAKKGE